MLMNRPYFEDARGGGDSLRWVEVPCMEGRWCRHRHAAVLFGNADVDRWVCVALLYVGDDPAEWSSTWEDAMGRRAVRCWGVPWAGLDATVVEEQLAAGLSLGPMLWDELGCWPVESLTYVCRLRTNEFGGVGALLALTRRYRMDTGGTNRAVR